MSLSLIGIPSKVVDETASPEVTSYLLATDAPIEFEFQRNEGNIVATTESGSPSGFAIIECDGDELISEGDTITLYDEDADEMVSATVTSDLGSNQYLLSIEYDSDRSFTYLLNQTQRANYYVEIRLKINGVYQTSIRYSPDTTGNLIADISAYLRSEVNGDKDGNYENDNDAETNQSGSFLLEYRERYSGDSNSYTEEGNTWYYVYAIRSKEQGANLSDYVFTGDGTGKFFNEFTQPIYTVGTPLDIQFWWPEDYADLSVKITQLDAGLNILDTQTVTLAEEARGRFLTSVKINQVTLEGDAYYLDVEIIES